MFASVTPIDIIVPVYNNYLLTKRCISSIFRSTRCPYRIIIINDASSEAALINYLERLKKEKNIICITNNTNLGRTKSVNLGIKASKARVVAIIDNDVVLPDNWVRKIIRGFYYSARVAALGPLFNDSINPHQYLQFKSTGLAGSRLENKVNQINHLLDKEGENGFQGSPYIFGACMVVKRSVFKKCGYFDELFKVSPAGYFDDIDLCFRLIKSGFQVGVCKNLFVYHYNGSSYKDMNKRLADLRKGFCLFKEKWENDKLFEYIPEQLRRLKDPATHLKGEAKWQFDLDYTAGKVVVIKDSRRHHLNGKNKILSGLKKIIYQERIDPILHSATFLRGIIPEHIARYRFANKYIKGKVLDIGCGTGYGLRELNASLYSSLTGIDISKEAIDFANKNYLTRKSRFQNSDFFSFNHPKTFDTIIAFEFIEHHKYKFAAIFLKKVLELMKRSAFFLISTPLNARRDRFYPENPFHKREYSYLEFRKLLGNFGDFEIFGQNKDVIEGFKSGSDYTTLIGVCRK
ncbi:MAG: glycosyltransferase [Candidatus Omnitrophica bacterium]|nr:glycosyltransferase [Candidatus Omnitrophota bacterium]